MADTTITLVPMFSNSAKMSIGSSEITKTYRCILGSDVAVYGGVTMTGSAAIACHVRDNFSSYNTLANLFWKSVDVTQSGNDGLPMYDITITYDNVVQDYNTNDVNSTVIAENAQYRWGTTTVQMGMEFDIAGGKMLTSAGEPFVQVLEQDFYKTTYSVTKSVNITTFDAYVTAVLNILGSVNDASVPVAGGSISFAPYCSIFKNFTSEAVYTADWDVWYYRVTFEFENTAPLPINGIQKSATDPAQSGYLYSHQRAILDQGTYYKDSGGNKQVFRVAGETTQQPGNLDGSGGMLAENGTPVFLIYQTRPVLSWSAIMGGID